MELKETTTKYYKKDLYKSTKRARGKGKKNGKKTASCDLAKSGILSLKEILNKNINDRGKISGLTPIELVEARDHLQYG